MRTSFVVGLLMLVAVPLRSQPKIEIVGGNSFEFGKIYRGKIVDRILVVKNTGNKNLELGQVNVSCGCTGTVVSNSNIAPGKTGEIKITFNSTNFSDSIHKSVTINSNAANAPQLVVQFSGYVVQEIAVSPQQFWFRDAEVGRPSYATITLKNNSSEPIALTSYQTNLQGFSLTLPKEKIAPGQSVDLTAELKAKVPVSVLNDGVSIKTSSKNEPDVFVRIFGAVKEFKFQ
jgi:P pilus assembly chaperone PapD